MKLPDFIIIGAAKAGTTTLYEYLCRHPQIYMSTPKEPEFFARDDRYRKGLNWYSSLFEQAKSNQICGEASTIYTLWPHFPLTAARMAQVIPHVKLIYLMRHPVDRAFSYYVQLIKTAQNTKTQLKISLSFEDCIKQEKESSNRLSEYLKGANSHLPNCPGLFLDGSNYMQQIKQYLELFPRESMLFLLMDDLISNPSGVLEKVCKFIGVDEGVDLVKAGIVKANLSKDHQEWFLRSIITSPLKNFVEVKKIVSILPQQLKDNIYEIVKQLPYTKQIKTEYLPEPMLPETREMLLEIFREPNHKLAEFLNRDLSHWEK